MTPHEAVAAARLPEGWRLDLPVDADAPALRSLVGAAFAEYPGCVLDPEGIDADLDAWASELAAAGGQGWVARAEDDSVGAMVAVAPTGEHLAELKRLYVASDLRRRGIGGALVELVASVAGGQLGATTLELWTDTRFTDAHRRYLAAGFVRTGEQRQLHDPSDTTEDRMVRDLGAHPPR